MKKISILFYLLATVVSASAIDPKREWTETLGGVTDASHRYLVTLAYVPNTTEGAAKPAGVYNVAVFSFKVQTLVWKQSVLSLAKALENAKLEPSTDSGRWAAGVRIEDRTNSMAVFSMEISIPAHVISINGKIYAADPEIIDWFRRELLPAVKDLNKGYPIKDL